MIWTDRQYLCEYQFTLCEVVRIEEDLRAAFYVPSLSFMTLRYSLQLVKPETPCLSERRRFIPVRIVRFSFFHLFPMLRYFFVAWWKHFKYLVWFFSYITIVYWACCISDVILTKYMHPYILAYATRTVRDCIRKWQFQISLPTVYTQVKYKLQFDHSESKLSQLC